MSLSLSSNYAAINRNNYLPYSDDSDRSILIVDDDPQVRTMLRIHLSGQYLCATASSAEEAIKLLKLNTFAVVLTDVIMPGLSGVELLREVTAHYPETIVIIFSCIDRTQRVIDAVRLGAFDYLIKPVDLDVLDSAIERALQRREILRSAKIYKQDLERRNMELAESKTKLQKLQTQIVHNEKMASLGQLAAGVAHELNNPAAFIIGNLEFLDEAADGLEKLLAFYASCRLSCEEADGLKQLKEEIAFEHTLANLRSIVNDCHEGATRIRDVVQNLRLFSRLDEAEVKKIDLHEGIESTIRLLSKHFNTGQIRLTRDYGQLPLVDCYAGQLNQVWLNLLVNAAQALKDGGEVKITTKREAQNVIVTINDNGTGIAPQNIEKIFDPFFTTKPVGEGTGLGLSVTYSIIERHGGTIAVASQIGKGTTFIVTVPINANQDQQKPK
jgi:signal transduction histidine kinase